MKKINKIMLGLGCGILPLTCALPCMVSCNNGENTLDSTGVEKNLVGYLASDTATSGYLIISGFKYTVKNGAKITASLENVSWEGGSYGEPEIIDQTKDTFAIQIKFSHTDPLDLKYGTFDLKVNVGDKTF